ncbi:ATP-binding protein [Streptomyces sp. NPDC087297]|uniref:ATP-binding protein n=1 Tax=Streptomyces sp. NPDC087297 TaxID=3365778 RepID=UPI0038004E4F
MSTDAVDYLQRNRLVPQLHGGSALTSAMAARRAVRITGVGRSTPLLQAPPTENAPTGKTATENMPTELPTTPLLVGLAGAGVPIACLFESHGQGVSVRMGTWDTERADGTDGTDIDARQSMLLSVLDGCYPAVDLAAASVATPRFTHGALALGVPTTRPASPRDRELPIDRFLRSMTGRRWAALVLAVPVGVTELAADRNRVLNEMRAVATAVHSTGLRSPLAEHYLALLQARLDAVADAQACGGWRTGVYLLSTSNAEVNALCNAWRAVFCGSHSVPEPVRTTALPGTADLAERWALPDDQEQPGPGLYRHPYAAQTILSSPQLAAYVHLPAVETAGFGVRTVPRFDVLSPPAAAPAAVIGTVIERDRRSPVEFEVPLDSLSRHVFVGGVTGSGKSNTVLHLIRQVAAAGIPFLVVEPAKAEYRALLRDPAVGPSLRVFTLGRETIAPLRLNPFDIPDDASVAEHVDLLRATFEAAFGMWVPLPHVLERCLHEIYSERGWDMRTGTNHRLDARAPTWTACPTLGDLAAKIPVVARSLGYEEKIAADIEAALSTRVRSLRLGGKGALFDVPRSFPMSELLAGPTIIELEAMGSDDDKAFVIGLLLVRLAEYRRAKGQQPGLTHLFVVEEAHRLLGAAPRIRAENVADPRGSAVETFAHLLSEIRAYGQGVVIADQVPTRLAPDVLKNTQLKIAHRTVAADDRLALATTMGMDAAQSEALVSLEVGRAAVFGYGADAPVLVQVPPAKDDALIRTTSDAAVHDMMAAWRTDGGWDGLWLPAPACAEVCTEHPVECAAARSLLDDSAVRRVLTRVVLSLLGDPGSVERTAPDLVQVVRARLEPSHEERAVLRSLVAHGADWYAARRGAQGGWDYSTTLDYAQQLRQALLTQDPQARAAFRAFAMERHTYGVAPFPRCTVIGPDHACPYRGAVADAVDTGRFAEMWAEADASDRAEGGRQATWRVCDTAAYELVEYPQDDAPPEEAARIEDRRRRAGLCFAQHMLAADGGELPRSVARITDSLMEESSPEKQLERSDE